MATVLDLITDALVSLGELGQGESLSAEDAQYGFTRLNTLIDSWSIERLYVPSISIFQYAMTPNKTSYGFGPGAPEFPGVARPIKIESAAVMVAVGSGYVRSILTPLSEQEYASLRDQGALSNLSERFYYDYGYPYGRVYIHPAPTCLAPTFLELASWSPVSQFTSVNQAISLPVGYYHALLWNLCIELAPGYDLPPNPVIQAKAEEGKRRIASLNMQNLPPQVQQQIAQSMEPQAPQQPPQ